MKTKQIHYIFRHTLFHLHTYVAEGEIQSLSVIISWKVSIFFFSFSTVYLLYSLLVSNTILMG